MEKINLKNLTFLIFISVIIFISKPIFSSQAKESETIQNLELEGIENFNRNQNNYNVKLEISDKKNQKIAVFKVALADNDQKRRYGLMHLKEMPKNNGMLFIFEKNEIVNMWMKNTDLTLDMLFIDDNNKIVNIKSNAKPYSLDIISSQKKVTKVLEINGGLAEKIGIRLNSKITITK